MAQPKSAIDQIAKDLAGTTIGGIYQFEAYSPRFCIGYGQWGLVLRGVKVMGPALKIPIAIKVPLPQLFEDREALAKFNDEVRLITALRHPSLVQAEAILPLSLYDKELTSIVMPFADSGNLATWIPRKASAELNWPAPINAYSILRALLEGLEYLHERGYVHTDIKADNILVFEDQHPRIADFGLMRAMRPEVLSGTRSKSQLATGGRRLDDIHPEVLDKLGKRGFKHQPYHDLHALGRTLSRYAEQLTRNMKLAECRLFLGLLYRLSASHPAANVDHAAFVWGNSMRDEPFASATEALQFLYKAERARHQEEAVPELGSHWILPPIRLTGGLQVPTTPRVREILDHPIVQRLGWIEQLDSCASVYPGARHSRLEHSLHVLYWARQYLRRLLEFPEIRLMLDPTDLKAVLLASLLHDVGHYPFAHSIGDLTSVSLENHERIGRNLLSGQPVEGLPTGDHISLNALVRDQWGVPEDYLIKIAWGPVPLDDSYESRKIRLLHSIIDGPLDIDKVAYLRSDGLHTGNPVGLDFDVQQLLNSIRPSRKLDCLAITDKGIAAAESMVVARYRMYSDVYWHHTARARRTMIARAIDYIVRYRFKRARRKASAEVQKALLERTDHDVLTWLWQQSKDAPPARIILRHLLEYVPTSKGAIRPLRLIYKRLFEEDWPMPKALSHEIVTKLRDRRYRNVLAIDNEVGRAIAAAFHIKVKEGEVIVDIPVSQELKQSEDPPHAAKDIQVVNDDGIIVEPLSTFSEVATSAADVFRRRADNVRILVSPRLLVQIGDDRLKSINLLSQYLK